MSICLIFVLYDLQSYRVESFTKYMCMYIFCPTKTDLFLNIALFHTNHLYVIIGLLTLA